jgi:RNA polymerase sigma factor (sigma-70 family)
MDRLTPCSDSQLISRCGGGDDTAWDEFVSRFNRRISLYVMREKRANGGYVGSEQIELVRDLTQEVYVRLLANDRRALRAFRGNTDCAVLAYLTRIVHGVVTDQVRRERSQKRSVSLVPLDAGGGEEPSSPALGELLSAGDETLPDRMLAERSIDERLNKLAESALSGTNVARDTMIFRLYALEGLSAREIAKLPALNMTLPSVEAVIHRTRDRLRSALGDAPDLLV